MARRGSFQNPRCAAPSGPKGSVSMGRTQIMKIT